MFTGGILVLVSASVRKYIRLAGTGNNGRREGHCEMEEGLGGVWRRSEVT